jgi:hypothetical protein
MIRTTIINYNGVELECKGYYSPYKDNGYDTEPDYECFEIDSVYYNDNDVTALLNSLNLEWSDLECRCIEALKD